MAKFHPSRALKDFFFVAFISLWLFISYHTKAVGVTVITHSFEGNVAGWVVGMSVGVNEVDRSVVSRAVGFVKNHPNIYAASVRVN